MMIIILCTTYCTTYYCSARCRTVPSSCINVLVFPFCNDKNIDIDGDDDDDIMYYVVLDTVPSSSINILLLLFVMMKIR